MECTGAIIILRRSRNRTRDRQYVVANTTHIDALMFFGYGLQAMLPFAWSALKTLASTIEGGATSLSGTGVAMSISTPSRSCSIAKENEAACCP
jgi:hypothetical protein